MKFQFVIDGTYEVDEADAERDYGTTDPVKMALIDLQLDPRELLEWGQNVTLYIEPIEEGT